MRKLTPAQMTLRDCWIYAYLVSTNGLDPNNKYPEAYYGGFARQYSKRILDEINNRLFTNLDSDFNALSTYRFRETLDSSDSWGKKKSPEMLAAYVASWCVEHGILWDDTNAVVSPSVINDFKATKFGEALNDFDGYVSQQKTAAKTRTSSTRAPGQAPQNPYKSTGPQSGNLVGIVGNSGQKISAPGSIMYSIEADKVGSNTPNVFIRPINSTTAGKAILASSGLPLVKFGSGNFYTDCRCWFDNAVDADAYMQKCVAAGIASKFTNVHVVQSKADSNGYYKVNTDYGEVYIKASKLNECLAESKEEQKCYVGDDVFGFAEDLHKYDN